MSQSNLSPKKPTRLQKILNGQVEQTIKTRLPRRMDPTAQVKTASSSPASDTSSTRYRFLPAFWTFTGLLSLVVNIVLLAVTFTALRMLGAIQLTANDQFSGLLGGLYQNFVKMDEATIASNVPVDAMIPLDIIVPVQTTTRITLAEAVTIPNAHVVINTGGVNIDADAVVTLPASTPLMVTLDFPLTVRNSIPIHLDVSVNIPLKNTQLHEPFVGLQNVVKPFYCIVEPNAVVNNVQVCSPIQPLSIPTEQVTP